MRHKEMVMSIEDLEHDSDNPRTHTSIENRRAVRSSLMTHGQIAPILVQSGTNRIIHGNLRVELMREMGISKASCWVIDASDQEIKRLAITLNRSGELAGWDEGVLARQLAELQEELQDFDVNDMGFSDEYLASLVDSLGEVADDFFFEDDDPYAEDEPESSSVASSESADDDELVVQLFIDKSRSDEWNEAVKGLASKWGLDNVTDVVLRSVLGATQ
jgi:hypothetical protein